MKKNNEDGAIFYAPDSFDRSVLAYCTSSPAISKSDASDCYTYALNSVGDVSVNSFAISGAVDTVKDSIGELRDRVVALEAAVAVAAQQKASVSMPTWRYGRRDYKTLK